MKITVLNKRVSTNVLAQTAAEAARLFLEADELKGAQINNVLIKRIVVPGAPLQTALFSDSSGVHVLGNFPGLLEHLRENPDAVTVWDVTIEAEFVTEYEITPPNDGQQQPAGTVVGSIGSRGEITDPGDRMPAPNVPPKDVALQSARTEGDT